MTGLYTLLPEGPDTSLFRYRVPKPLIDMVFAAKILNYQVSGPSGYLEANSNLTKST